MRLRRASGYAALVLVLGWVACATERQDQGGQRLTRADLIDPSRDSVLTWNGPTWHLHDGRLFSIFAHTFGGRLFDREQSLAEVVVRNNLRYPQTLTFWLDAGPYADEAVKEIELQPDEVRTVHLSPTWNFDRLYGLRSPTPVNLQGGFENHFTGHVVNFDISPILEPVTRLQWKVPSADKKRAIDLRPYAIMLVTPDDRAGEVQKLVREAAAFTSIGRFRGYDGATLDDVTDQVSAIYQALQKRGFIYNSVASTYFDEVQRVRLPAESLQQNHGNCIDTSLVFASAFEAVGLEPLLIFMTGHAFVGVDQTPAEKNAAQKTQMVLVETTLVSGRPFVDAMNRGAKVWRQAKQAGDDDLIMLDVKKGRRAGMYPVNF